MRVVVQLLTTSQPLEYSAVNTYQSGDFYCVYTIDGIIYKFPMVNIFRVIEEYGIHGKNIEEKKEYWFGKRLDQKENE